VNVDVSDTGYRRVVAFIPADQFCDMFGVPRDVKCVWIQGRFAESPRQDGFSVVFEHPEFDLVEEGQEMPVLLPIKSAIGGKETTG
jgi:hypothetical protein